MEKFKVLPRFYGPALTLIFILFYHGLADRLGWPVNMIWITVFVVYGTFVSGLRGGLLSAGFGVVYALYTLAPDRALQVAVGLPLIASVIGWQTRAFREALAEANRNRRAANIVDSVNGNIRLNLEAIRILDEVLVGWEITPAGITKDRIEDARGKLADLATMVKGYHAIARERGFVEGDGK